MQVAGKERRGRRAGGGSGNSGSSRIASKFAELRARNERGLVTYAMTGFPSERASVSAVSGMVRGGADVIELGFPFSDPLADGPVIQEASSVALGRGATFEGFLRTASRVRRANRDVPLVLMTYTNILYNLGYDRAASMISDAGIDGIILPDMAADESAPYMTAARRCGLDTIFLASPNTPAGRLRRIASLSTGFLYMVAVYGTTGVRGAHAGRRAGGGSAAGYALDAIRRAKRTAGRSRARLPIGVGFGISSPADVRQYVGAGADAVIVGSAYTKIIKESAPRDVEKNVSALTKRLKAATRSAS